jgi:TPR repeat protein
MTVLRPVSILLGCLMLATSAAAQISLTPPGVQTPPTDSKPEKPSPKKPEPKKPEASKPEAKPSVAKKPSSPAEPSAAQTPPTASNANVDMVYGAFQRGFYKTAFDLASKRVRENNDPKAMTMLGELYANQLGIKRDYAKAAEWYKRAADAGDREAMFALAMLELSGRNGTAANREDGARWLASSAKLGNPKAAYNLALLYLDGQTFPQDLRRAAELLRIAADAGNPEAQYALATFYKEGTGVEKNDEKATQLLHAAALADNLDAEVEYAIALFNGTGTPKNETAAVGLLYRAARQNSPIAQNRLASVLVNGWGGIPVNKVEGLKWHLVAKTAGKGDLDLDKALADASPEDRAKAQEAARKWIGAK